MIYENHISFIFRILCLFFVYFYSVIIIDTIHQKKWRRATKATSPFLPKNE